MSTSTLIETPAAQNEHATLFVGFELGRATWLIGLHAPELGRTVSRYKIDGGDLGKVLELTAAMRRRLEKLGKPVWPSSDAAARAGGACGPTWTSPDHAPGVSPIAAALITPERR